MTVGRNGINVVRNGRTVWEPNPCGTPHHNYPETRCTEPAGHYRPDRDPHAGPLIIDGREVGAAAWDEPKESSMTDQTATQATEPDYPRLQRKVRRILAALSLADRPLTVAELIRAACHSAGNVVFTLYRLERAGWISRGTGVGGASVYGLTAEGRRYAGFVSEERQSPLGVREVRVVVRAPSDENAGQWAETIRDLVLAKYGDSMRLEVTILPGGES